MVDRKARDELATLLQSYMDEKITAFQLDEGLWKIADATSDKTVDDLTLSIWLFYDDLKDHKIVGSKEAWDCLSRILLLLQSNAERVVVKRHWHWHMHHAVAAASLAGFLAIAMNTGWDGPLMIYAIPFGLVSMALAWWRDRIETAETRAESALLPFPSVGSLLKVRRSVPQFSKRRYPSWIQRRTIRAPWMSRIMMAPAGLAWLVFSPVVLFLQMLPSREAEVEIRLPQGSEDEPPSFRQV